VEAKGVDAGLMKQAKARKPTAEPSDKLLEILAAELLDGGKDRVTVEGIEARYPHWSGAAWRRLHEIHLAACEKKHGRELFEAKQREV